MINRFYKEKMTRFSYNEKKDEKKSGFQKCLIRDKYIYWFCLNKV